MRKKGRALAHQRGRRGGEENHTFPKREGRKSLPPRENKKVLAKRGVSLRCISVEGKEKVVNT